MSELICEWFALCDHPATHLAKHPILHQVPICDRCIKRMSIPDEMLTPLKEATT